VARLSYGPPALGVTGKWADQDLVGRANEDIQLSGCSEEVCIVIVGIPRAAFHCFHG